MFHDVTPLRGALFVAWVPAMLYGANVVVSGGYFIAAFTKGLSGSISRILLAVAVVQFCIATAHVVVCGQYALDALVYAGNREAFSEDQSQWTHLTQTTLYAVNNFIADMLMIWRLYVVYGKNWMICVPFVIPNIAGLVSFLMSIEGLSHITSIQTLLKFTSVGHWTLAGWSISIYVQVSISLLLAWKIWNTERSAYVTSSRGKSVVLMILESGAILSCTTISLLAMYVDKRVAGEIIAAALGQIDTLVPTSILLRVALSERYQHASSKPSSSFPWSRRDRFFASSTDRTAVTVEVAVDRTSKDGSAYDTEMRKAEPDSLSPIQTVQVIA